VTSDSWLVRNVTAQLPVVSGLGNDGTNMYLITAREVNSQIYFPKG